MEDLKALETPFTSTVKEIIKIDEWFNPHNNQTMYFHNMLLENGQTISIGKTVKDAFQIGDTIMYKNINNKNGGISQKEIQQPGTTKTTGSKVANYKAYNKQVALQAAVELLKNQPLESLNAEKILNVATTFQKWLDS